MQGKQNHQKDLFTYIQLDELVPKDHILRKIRDVIDFSFIDELTEPYYSEKGRPSVDPQVLIRMMLIGYLFGIDSERRLCVEVHLNLAYRWFCDLSLEDKVPNHSTFSKNRHGRFGGKDLFKQLFYKIVEQAVDKGLVIGKRVSCDASTISADASMGSLDPIVVDCSKEDYFRKLCEDESEAEKKDDGDETPDKKEKPKRSNQTHRSKSDPDSRITTQRGKPELVHSDNILIDSESRVILDVEVTEKSRAAEADSCIDMLMRSRLRYNLKVESLLADGLYGMGKVVSALYKEGVDAYIAPPAKNPNSPESKGIYSAESFKFDEQGNCLICPAGKKLKRKAAVEGERADRYIASRKDCGSCQLKEQCTKARAREVLIHWDREALQWAESLRKTRAYKENYHLRKRIESLFGEAKEQMGLRRARLRGREHVSEQCIMTAMAQNIKRIVNAVNTQPLSEAVSACSALHKALIDHIMPFTRKMKIFKNNWTLFFKYTKLTPAW